METFRQKLEEVSKILSPSFAAEKSDKIRAYQELFELATTTSDACSMQLLGNSANVVVSLLIPEVLNGDEEMGSLALKCLGSMLYHPSIVPKITGENAVKLIDSIVKIISTTRKKSVCKLAVWCISVQQFDASYLNAHFHSLLRAIICALDNPISSLSVTYEAMQAVMKLASCGKKMTETSNSWAPPIYRRLVSADNRDREMADKCLLKIKFLICPAPTSLLQKVLLDVKDNFLPAMTDLLNNGMKVQAMKAWGWFVRLLGPRGMKSKHLVNNMLKIAEQAFSDIDPQVQIAGLVSWETMIDVYLLLPTQAFKGDLAPLSAGGSCPDEAEKCLRKIKLIMTPLIGIMSTKFDVSVHLTCLNTWCYLLHKLDISVSSDLVIQSVWEPLLEVVFRAEPDDGTALLWNICLDMLEAFINARISHSNDTTHLEKTSAIVPGTLASGKFSWKHYVIKWLPWNLHQLDFFIRRICSFINQASNVAVSREFKRVAHNAALKLSRSLLRAVNSIINSISTGSDEIMLCMKAVFGFLKKICENETLEDGKSLDFIDVQLQLVAMVAEELEPSIMGAEVRDYKQETDTVLYIGDIGSFILEQFLLRVRLRQTQICDSDNEISANMRSCIKFSSRLLKLAFAEGKFDIQPFTIRIFSTLIQFISSLNFKGDILAFVEATESPLLDWVSLEEIKDDSTSCQLQGLWAEILNSFVRSQPSIKFDSSFLAFQASLLEKTLDHWNFTISASTINFWNSTYGAEPQLDLEYPQNLHSILDKLYRNGKIHISRMASCTALKKCRVYAELKSRTDLQGENEMQLSLKRRKVELTEHQKEVRRAQQGRSRDCSGHGPGIRTYTSVDFSQVNEEESQESQMI